MRFTLATLLFVPALIAAAPTPDERVVIMVEGNTPSKAPKAYDFSSKPSDICLKICAPQTMSCPDGWESRKFDSCYTCCLTEQKD
ncbi:hypothetical protein BU16DRAFT_562673 [Lophium mytilinum]|uniref:Uncharacterized protein n=1 Tax=Lophium mytilinum TaxID=390894 RepID=A0A6A6QS52_9PEZI|nr:hypothetical protein BU16DRAFT_562673 [Lophium mytilinum]